MIPLFRRRLMTRKVWVMRLLVAGGIVLLIPVLYLFVGWPAESTTTSYGVTWSRTYADYLGIDSQVGLTAVLQDLNVKRIRLPAYWSDLQPTGPDSYDWKPLEEQLQLIGAHGAKAIVVVGAKQPRWPEWWVPNWANKLSIVEEEKAQLAYVEAVVRKLANDPTVLAWQVENEPLFPYGNGRAQRKEFILKEMALVRQLEQEFSQDSRSTFHAPRRPVYTTDSGELATWLAFDKQIDGLGISVYRVVTVPFIGAWHYWFLPPWFYRRHAQLLSPWISPVFVSEFQMEPWVNGGIIDSTFEQQMKTLDLDQMQDNFWFVERMRVPAVYFWGAEWWYWVKNRFNHPEFWNTAKQFFASHQGS